MSYSDFCLSTPEEFSEIYKSFSEHREELYKEEWERIRMLATIVIQPHVKQKLTATRLLPFPWDSHRPEKKYETVMTNEERKARMEEVKKLLGEKF